MAQLSNFETKGPKGEGSVKFPTIPEKPQKMIIFALYSDSGHLKNTTPNFQLNF